MENNNSPVNIRFVAKTSDIRNFSQNIRSDVKTSEVVTQLRNTHAAAGRAHVMLLLAYATCYLVVIVFTPEKTRVAAKCTNERAQGKINKKTTV